MHTMWRWADQCEFEHDTSRQKTDGTWVGQNLYLHGSSNQYTYEEVRHCSYLTLPGACYGSFYLSSMGSL